MAKTQPTFYVFHGEDDYTIRAEVQKMRQKMDDDLNISEFDGTKTPVVQILSAAQSIPFLGDKRLVIVEGLLSYLSRKGASQASKNDLARLVEALPKLPEFTRLIFVEMQSLSAKHPVLQIVNEDPSGYAKDFSAPKNPTLWIKKAAESYGVEIDNAAVQALTTLLTRDKKINLRETDNEIIKLAAYVGEGGIITEKTVHLLTTYVSETNIFEMVDALAQRDGKTALTLAHQLLDDGKQNDPLSLFGMIIRQFRLLIQAREVLDDHGTINDLPEIIGVHPFVAKKLVSQARQFPTIHELEEIYQFLLKIDVDIKTGRILPHLGLDLFISTIAR